MARIKDYDNPEKEAEHLIQSAEQNRSLTLDLSGIGIESVPDTIVNLTQVKDLDLSDNDLFSLPGALGKLIQLRTLSLKNNKLISMAGIIDKLTQLEYLDLESNQLDSLPSTIGKLIQLRYLYLSSNRLASLPDTIGELAELESLYLDGNQLDSLPDAIGRLTKLKSLIATSNKLTSLPNTIGNLTQMKDLDLKGCQLTSLPDAIGNLIKLEYLDLGSNRLTSLPDAIGKLTELRSLYVGYNQLTSLPDAIGKLAQIRRLHLNGNELTSLPDAISRFTRLRHLDLGSNRLTSLPDVIGKLTQLQCLSLERNKLTSLPAQLRHLVSLKQLFLHDNPGLRLPREVLGATFGDVASLRAKPTAPTEIIDYYFRILAGEKPLNEAKLILVGHGAVGKTSLVKRLVLGEFDPKERETQGIRITEWPITLRTEEKVCLNIWDFGGQEIMHSTHQFFLTTRSLYLLVQDGRQGHEDADAEYWLSLIRSFGKDSPVIVVLNKIKERPFDLNRPYLKQKYPAIRDFVATDCEDGTGIEDLRQIIERETDRLEHLRDAFPASWFEIKNRLSGMDEDYITFERYRNICKKYREESEKAQDDLAGYLHNLGIALNFKDDPRLRDTHVLNPRWVTEGIYAILNASILADKKGELYLSHLSGILDNKVYPSGRHLFLLELMRKFELCFKFPDYDEHYLVPELLDKQQAPEAKEFTPAECLNFQYEYPVLPEGLLPRFIVRTHVLSTDKPRWRTGVILEFEGNRALVKADIQGKCIDINVSGPAAGRRRLLAVIRSDFAHIHRSFTFAPRQMVPVPERPDLVIPYEKLCILEAKGVHTFPEVAGDDVIEIQVQDLLNGVDMVGSREIQRPRERTAPPLRLFYSYSHRDENLRDQLENHLKIFQQGGLIEQWHDRRITAGKEWEGEIDDNLEHANVVLLLVSADFIASEYCYDIEMKRALERHESGEARVIPIIIRDVKWHLAPFAKLQALPTDGKPVKTWPDRDTAWKNVADGIEKVIKDMQAKRPRETFGPRKPHNEKCAE